MKLFLEKLLDILEALPSPEKRKDGEGLAAGRKKERPAGKKKEKYDVKRKRATRT